MKESALTAKIGKRVRDRGGWCRKVHGGPYGAGWPDLCGVYRGVSVMFEVKLPGKEKTLTELQRQTLIDLRRVGSIALMVTSVRQADYVLDCIDKTRHPGGFYAGELIRVQARARLLTRQRARGEEDPALVRLLSGE